MADTHVLTKTALDRLRAEYEDLTTNRKIDIARKIEAARELGDLSENGDYHAAKEEQGKMAGRISQIHAILENAAPVTKGSPDTVREGKLVSLRFDGENVVEHFVIGSIEERSDAHDVVSPTSAMGVALLDHAAGDTVEYEAPTGAMLKVDVIAVEDWDEQ